MISKMDMPARASLVTSPALLQAVQRLLRPLARLLMAYGVNFVAFSNLAKGVFVDVAAREFHADDGVVTDSRVSLLSGVHRREVKRLREEMLYQMPPPPVVSLGAQVVSRWCAEAAFLDHQRRPLPLPRLASQGGDVSFERLVESVSKDIRPRAVLDEWLRLGAVTLDQDDQVHLVEHAFVPARGMEEKSFYLGKNIGDHLAAASHNLLDGQTPFLERSVYCDGLSPESAEQLRGLSRELAIDAMQAINRRALELQEADNGRANASQRMTFGVYYYAEDTRPVERKEGR
ncbi:MAG: hypothetical protein COW48_04760 [Hydrogenophilales bacterium CG17_big_fil_post_rev_8_21_14_2_50_63_12]|nr:MAG: hypothetical protein COW48_04760 [Hydrogenophilales bacterium CG17_big_fil_post_rev_8_21_14_2_50_63_12]PIX97565.1 MAG: hypothetical protein COZ24_04635 [Hydrogenophilales bacterium CG_4_10_14_3_um_filter_63_21]